MRRLSFAFAPLALLAATAVLEPPDFTGFWNLDFGPLRPESRHMVDRLPPDTVLLADTGVPEFPEGEYCGLKPKPEALARE